MASIEAVTTAGSGAAILGRSLHQAGHHQGGHARGGAHAAEAVAVLPDWDQIMYTDYCTGYVYII